MKILKRPVLITSFFVSMLVWATAGVEVVVTTPENMDLAVPGIRETKAVWVEMFQSAKKSILLEQFYVSDQKGEALEPVLNALREAMRRGVKVRLLADKKFYGTYPETIKEFAGLENGESRIINFDAISKGVQHSKFFVVDGKESFLGSANFDWRALSHIHEVGVRIIDEAFAANLTQVFEMDWKKGEAIHDSWENKTSIFSGNLIPAEIRLVVSPDVFAPQGTQSTINAIIDAIESAEKSIRVQVYEYSTGVFGEPGKKWLELDESLRRAAARGVKVDLLLDATKVASAKKELMALGGVKNITVKGLAVPQLSTGPIPYARLIHSKYMVVDGVISWVGTDNWSKSYFMNSRGVGIMSDNIGLAKQLDQVYSRLWSSPYVSVIK